MEEVKDVDVDKLRDVEEDKLRDVEEDKLRDVEEVGVKDADEDKPRDEDAEEVVDEDVVRVHVDPIEIVVPIHGILLRITFWVAATCRRQFKNGRIRRKREVKNFVDFTTL